MPATTIDTVLDAFTTAIEGITPRMQEQRATARWKAYEGPRLPSTEARRFKLKWSAERFTPAGFFGPIMCDKTFDLDVIVDYGGIREARADTLAGDDHHQVHDVLQRLKPSLPGFLNITPIDWDYLPGTDPDQAQIVLQYEVRYMRARA